MAFGKNAPTLFISYRRDDAGGHAGRLWDWLKRQFGQQCVFLDPDIEYGDVFAQVLKDRLAACDTLIVVIGPDWLECRNESGRRLDQADDYVRMEVETGLSRQIRVIPVLVGGADMPTKDRLPESMHPLLAHNAAIVAGHSFERDFNALVDDIYQRPRGYVRREVDRLKRLQRNLGLSGVISILIAIVVVFGLWLSVLSPINLDTMSENQLLWAADRFDPLPEQPGVLIVGIDDDSEAALGPPQFGPNAHWRTLHARLIERAIEGRARAVVFDLTMSRSTDADTRLAQAIRDAALSDPPLRVVIGVRQFEDDQPQVATALAAVPTGATCIWRRGQRYAAPLAVLDPASPISAAVPLVRPALALVGTQPGPATEADLERRRVRIEGVSLTQSPRFSSLERIGTSTCGTLAEDDIITSLLIRPSNPDYWQAPQRQVSYQAALDPGTAPAVFTDKVLLVGDTRSTSRDRHALQRGFDTTVVPGVQLHAEAMAALLNQREPVQPTVDQSLAWLGAMGLIGAVLGFASTPWRPALRLAASAGALVAYVVLALWLASRGYILNLPYDLTAYGLAYALLKHLQRRDANREVSP